MNIGPLSNDDKTKYRKVIFNLQKRYDLVIELLKLNNKICSYSSSVNSQSKEVDQILEYINKAFNNLEFVIDE